MAALPALDLNGAQNMWRDYVRAAGFKHGEEPPHVVECFGDNSALADGLLGAVMHGSKRATSSLASDYSYYDEPVPAVDDHWVVCDGSGTARIILKVVSVRRSSFLEVDAQFAAAEGEGDRSLASWREEHEKYFRRTQEAIGLSWTPEKTTEPGQELILERFEICWPPGLAD